MLAEEDPRLSGMARELLADLNGQLRALDERIANYDARLKAAGTADERCAKLAELPGVGPLTATALPSPPRSIQQRPADGREPWGLRHGSTAVGASSH